MTIEIKYDKHTQNTVEIKVENETHTLGSVVSDTMEKDKRCIFSSYKVLHPTDEFVFLRLGCDNSVSVKECLVENLLKLENETQDLINQINYF